MKIKTTEVLISVVFGFISISYLIPQRNFRAVDGLFVIPEIRKHTAGARVENVLFQCRPNID